MPKITDERKELLEKLETLNYTKEDVKGKSIKQLNNMVDKYNKATDVLDSVDTTLDSVIEEEVLDTEMPCQMSTVWQKMCRPEWTDYVLSLMEKHEKDNGHPKVDGLRRIALKLLGPYEIKSEVKQVPSDANGYRATVTVLIVFSDTYGANTKTYSGSADVSKANTAKEFASHPVATAETRAEGRALRRALFLTKVLAAEETYNADPNDSNEDEKINDSLINIITTLCEKQSLDPINLALSQNFEIQSLESLTKKQGRHLIDTVGLHMRKEIELPQYVKVG